jgi:hypothetical protein
VTAPPPQAVTSDGAVGCNPNLILDTFLSDVFTFRPEFGCRGRPPRAICCAVKSNARMLLWDVPVANVIRNGPDLGYVLRNGKATVGDHEISELIQHGPTSMIVHGVVVRFQSNRKRFL